MNARIATPMILILIVGIFAACNTNTTNTVNISEQDAGKTIELKMGDSLVVSLEGNITTGYSWIPAPQDPILLEQVGDIEVTPANDAIGASGLIVLKFKANEKGQTVLHLDYKRSWEEDVAPEKTFDVTVVVK
jgi:inhibitor of cysteine peptidase